MAPKPKKFYRIYTRKIIWQDGIPHKTPWVFIGRTSAVSEAQAKNNMRHRLGKHTYEWGNNTGSDVWDYENELKAKEE